jgi:release factor glutamine methyltransferase
MKPVAEEKKNWTIMSVLDWTRRHFESKKIEPARLDAEVLLAHALGMQRVMLYARFDQPLAPEELARIRDLVARRARGEPISYLLGEREFYSLELEVSPAVLIPRPDTETLVEAVIECVRGIDAPRLVDVGTGSGAIALALAKSLPSAEVVAVDVSPEALQVATRNAARHSLEARVRFVESDLLDRLEVSPAFDVVVANLPYIQTQVIPTLMVDVRDHEPHLALDGGPDGLRLIRRLAESAPEHLTSDGLLALEIGFDQRAAVLDLLLSLGYRDIESRKDPGGHDRVVLARRPAV